MKSFVASTIAAWAIILPWLAAPVGAQNLTIPADKWLNPTSDLPRSQREIPASNAAQQLIPHMNASGCLQGMDVSQATTFYSVLALQDYYSGNKSYANTVTSNMINRKASIPTGLVIDESNEDAIYWGLAFFYAYRTYGSEQLLDSSIAAYVETNVSFITPAQAQAMTRVIAL